MGGSSKHVLPVYLDGAKQVIADSGFDNNVANWNGLSSSVEISNDLAANGTLRLGVPNYYGTVVFVVNKDADQSVTVSDYTSGSDSTVRVLNAEQESVTLLYNGSNWVEIAASEASVPAFSALTGKPTTISGYGITDHSFTTIADKPNTISGYGITDTFKGLFKKQFSVDLDFSDYDGSVQDAAFDIDDVLEEIAALDVSLPDGHTSANKIIVHDVLVSIKTAGGAACVAKLVLSSDSGVAVNDAITNATEIYGAGITTGYAGLDTTGADIDLNAVAVDYKQTEIEVAIDSVNLYLVTETALAADITGGTGSIAITYSVI